MKIPCTSRPAAGDKLLVSDIEQRHALCFAVTAYWVQTASASRRRVYTCTVHRGANIYKGALRCTV